MPSSAVNICVFTLVLLSLQQICHCMPHVRSKRGLVKDYFVPDPAVFSADKFEKGEDGKYYLKKSSHRHDSEVKYSSAEDAEGKNTVPGDFEMVKDESNAGETIKSELFKQELTKKEIEGIATPPIVEERKVVADVNTKPVAAAEKTEKQIENHSEKAPFTPVDPKIMTPPKPDSKDEIPLKAVTSPEKGSREKADEKVSIGQVPDFFPRFVPVPGDFRAPILIPIRHISYKAVKVMPLPPAEVSDRLPVPYEDDIIGEGAHESESEEVSQPLAEEKKDIGYQLGNPLTMGLHLPLHSLRTFLEDLKGKYKLVYFFKILILRMRNENITNGGLIITHSENNFVVYFSQNNKSFFFLYLRSETEKNMS